MTVRPFVFRIALLAFWACAAFREPAFSAGPEIFLAEEPETYLAIDKLEGMGFLPEMLTGDRGLEALEVAREAEKAGEAGDPFIDGMLRFLRLGGGRRYDFRLRAGFAQSDDGRIPPNAQGIPDPRGGAARVGGFFRAHPADLLSIQGRGDLLLGSSGDREGRVEETSLRAGWPQATIEAGRFSAWWGPGRHGSIILSTNAEPLIGVRFRNPRPVSPGGPFRFLGRVQYDLFFAKLDGERPVPRPALFGMRLAARPGPRLEIGISRTFQYGGKGRENGFSEWWKAFKGRREGKDEQTNVANQMAGFDISVLFPFRAQPVKIYLEAEGEDQREVVAGIPVPYKYAFLAGVFFPSLLGSPRADLRVELAMPAEKKNGPVWYRHNDYPYEYRGRILGHHMGTDARDLYVAVHYFFLPSSYLEADFDWTRRDFPGPARETARRYGAAFVAWLTKSLRADGGAAIEDVSNEGGVPGRAERDLAFRAGLSYQFR